MSRCEPSDLIWENKKLAGKKRCLLYLAIIVISVILILVFFSMVFVMKAKSYELKHMFPSVS